MQKSSKRLHSQSTPPPTHAGRPAGSMASRLGKAGKRTTATKPTAQNIGNAFANLVRSDENVEGIWAREARNHLDIWLLTKPISHEQRLQLRGLIGQLRERFPKAVVLLHIENASLYEVDPSEFVFEIPHGALPVTLR